MSDTHRPSWRKPAGVFALLVILTVYFVGVARFVEALRPLPFAIEMTIYLLAGTGWIFAMRPLLRWMETGQWRNPPRK